MAASKSKIPVPRSLLPAIVSKSGSKFRVLGSVCGNHRLPSPRCTYMSLLNEGIGVWAAVATGAAGVAMESGGAGGVGFKSGRVSALKGPLKPQRASKPMAPRQARVFPVRWPLAFTFLTGTDSIHPRQRDVIIPKSFQSQCPFQKQFTSGPLMDATAFATKFALTFNNH